MTPRLSRPVRLILDQMLSAKRGADAELYGFELMQVTGLKSGTLYPALTRLHDFGWIEARKEDGDPVALGRPLRTYYRLTGDGKSAARLARARGAESVVALRPQLGNL